MFRFSTRFALPAAALLFALVPSLARAQAPQYHSPVVAANSTLSTVTYNNRFEAYGGLAYSHFNAGPSLLQGANLGGLDLQGAWFLTHKWAAAANVRGYAGTSGAAPNIYGIKGPFVSEFMVLGGPEYRVASNQHASLTLHALAGGSYGYFSSDLKDGSLKIKPGVVGFYDDQFAFGSAIGGSIDLNRSPRLAFRISPDAILTDYSSSGKSDFKEQFGLSVGLIYRFGRPIDPSRAGTPHPPIR